MTPQAGQTLWVTLAVALLVVVRFLVRELRVRRIPLGRLFLLPGFLGLISLVLIYASVAQAPDVMQLLSISAIAAVLVGAFIGLAVARFTTVNLAPEPNVVLVRGSIATVAIWVAALLLRIVGRTLAGFEGGPAIVLMLNTSLVIMLTTALTTVRVQILRRARSARATASP